MSTQDAVDFIRRQAKLHEQFLRVANDLERIGSLEGAAKEAVAAREKAEAELAKVQGAVADAIALAAKVEEDAHDAAGAKIVDAEEQAARILAVASEKANDTIASAERKARSVTETADMVVADAKVKFNDIQKSIAELEAERMSAEVERDKARTEYDGLTQALEKLKSKFKIGE